MERDDEITVAVNYIFAVFRRSLLATEKLGGLIRNVHTSGLKYTGKRGYNLRFEFVFHNSEHYPERAIRTINQSNRDSTFSITIALLNINEARSLDSKLNATLDAMEQPMSANMLDAMRNQGIKTNFG